MELNDWTLNTIQGKSNFLLLTYSNSLTAWGILLQKRGTLSMRLMNLYLTPLLLNTATLD